MLCGFQGRHRWKLKSEKLLPSEFEHPDRPVHRKLLHWLRCPTQGYYHLTFTFVCFPFLLPVPVLLKTCIMIANYLRHTQSVAWVCGRSLARIAGLNSAGNMVVSLLWGSCIWGLLLFQRKPTDFGVSKSNCEASIMRGPSSTTGSCAMGKLRHNPYQIASSQLSRK